MTDDEKLQVLNSLSEYVHNINNCVFIADGHLRKDIIGPKTITKIKIEIRKIQEEGVRVRLNLINAFVGEGEMKGDEDDNNAE